MVANDTLRDLLKGGEKVVLPPLPGSPDEDDDGFDGFVVGEEEEDEEEDQGVFEIWRGYQREDRENDRFAVLSVEKEENSDEIEPRFELDDGPDWSDADNSDPTLSDSASSLHSSTPSIPLTNHTPEPRRSRFTEDLPRSSPHPILRRVKENSSLADELKDHLDSSSSQPSSSVHVSFSLPDQSTVQSSIESSSPPRHGLPRLSISVPAPLLNGSAFELTSADLVEASPVAVGCGSPIFEKFCEGPRRKVVDDTMLCQRSLIKPWRASIEGLPEGLDPAFPPVIPSPYTSSMNLSSASPCPSPSATYPIPFFPYKPGTTSCRAHNCPIRQHHQKGPYLHEGKLRMREGAMFGASNPPPAIWDAYERMKARIVDPQMEKEKGWRLGKTQAKKDEGVVLAFAKVHFAEVTEVEMVGLQSRGFRSDSSVALGPRSTSTLALASLRGVEV